MLRTVRKHGYYEVQDEFGQFICTADTYYEAQDEIEKMEREWELD